jgi:hypothetical protein
VRSFFASLKISESRFWLLAMVLYCALVLPLHWMLAESMNPDGVSFIDLARFVQAGRWAELVNSYWGPLLPLLLAACPLELSFAPVQGLLGLVSLAYFACGAYLVRALWRNAGWLPGTPLNARRLAAGAFLVGLLTASHTVLAGPHVLTPDGLAGCFALLAAGLLLRAEREGHPLSRAVALGFVLGLGYLAKYPLFVFGLILLALLWRQNWRFAAAATATFAAVAGPWAALLSQRYQRYTFADSGWLNFAWFTDQLPRFGAHTAFAAKPGATYAAWLDPGLATAKPTLEIPWQRLLDNTLWHLSWVGVSPVLAGLLLLSGLLFLARRPALDWRFLWPAFAIASYLPVTLMCRYAAVWAVLAFGLWGAYALRARAQFGLGVLLILASLWGWRRIDAERLAAGRSLHFARTHLELRGQRLHLEGDPFAASIDLVRLRASVAPNVSLELVSHPLGKIH